MAAKRTYELIPLCHQIPLEVVEVDFRPDQRQGLIEIQARAVTSARTGVEMEALVAVSAAGLALYDMAKAIDRAMVMDAVRLVSKSRRPQRRLQTSRRETMAGGVNRGVFSIGYLRRFGKTNHRKAPFRFPRPHSVCGRGLGEGSDTLQPLTLRPPLPEPTMSSTPQKALARVILKKGRDGPVRGMNPWIFSQAIERTEPAALQPGEPGRSHGSIAEDCSGPGTIIRPPPSRSGC